MIVRIDTKAPQSVYDLVLQEAERHGVSLGDAVLMGFLRSTGRDDLIPSLNEAKGKPGIRPGQRRSTEPAKAG